MRSDMLLMKLVRWKCNLSMKTYVGYVLLLSQVSWYVAADTVLGNIGQYLNQGLVIGNKIISDDFLTYEEYLGIPYASPPIGELRFQLPLTQGPWDNTIDATSRPPACPQNNSPYIYPSIVHNQDENCLYLSVYIPGDRKSNFSVMVWFHGGDYQFGSISDRLTHPKNLVVNHEVIVVLVQYRLGPLGLLYLNSPEAPGNMALMDQQFALQWIKDNIASFGGDPSNITLMGSGTGAAFVHFHLLSAGSQSLFNRAILQSGSALSPQMFTSSADILQTSKQLVQVLNCNNTESFLTLQCLRNRTISDILNAELKISANRLYRFTPIKDGQFLENNPNNIMQNGNFTSKPILGGINENEGDFFLSNEILSSILDVPAVNNSAFVDNLSSKLKSMAPTTVTFLITLYRKLLSSSEGVQPSNLDTLRAMLGDVLIVCGTVSTLDQYATKNPSQTFMYVMNHKPSGISYPRWVGAAHTFELALLFGRHMEPDKCLGHQDTIVSQKIMTLWTNFAKTGNPNFESVGGFETLRWLPVGSPHFRKYLIINPSVAWLHEINYRHDICQKVREILDMSFFLKRIKSLIS